MTSQLAFRRTRSLWIVLLGIFLVTFGFTTYPVMAALNLDGEIGSEVFVVIYAYFTLALDIVGLCLLFYGLTNVLTRWPPAEASGTRSSLSGTLAAPFVYSRYSRLLLAFALSFRTKNARIGWLGGTGAFIGLFTSCPTCAGLAIVSVLGGTGALSASFFLGSLRTIFVAISIPILVAVPLLSARSLNTFNGKNCVIP